MIEDYYTEDYEIQRPTTQNVGGIAKVVYNTIYNIKGKLRPLSGDEIFRNEKNNYELTHKLYCNCYDIQPTDRVYDLKNNKYYEIVFVKNPMTLNIHLEIDLKCSE